MERLLSEVMTMSLTASTMDGVSVISYLTGLDQRIETGETDWRVTFHTPKCSGGTRKSEDGGLGKGASGHGCLWDGGESGAGWVW